MSKRSAEDAQVGGEVAERNVHIRQEDPTPMFSMRRLVDEARLDAIAPQLAALFGWNTEVLTESDFTVPKSCLEEIIFKKFDYPLNGSNSA